MLQKKNIKRVTKVTLFDIIYKIIKAINKISLWKLQLRSLSTKALDFIQGIIERSFLPTSSIG